MTLYGLDALNSLMDKYNEHTGGDFSAYEIEGGLLDSYIITADGCKTAIIKEVYLNEWSSAYTMRLYNKTPAKYARVISLLEDGDTDAATALFYA